MLFAWEGRAPTVVEAAEIGVAAVLEDFPADLDAAFQARVGEVKAIDEGFERFCRRAGLERELLLKAWYPPVVEEIAEVRLLLEGEIPVAEKVASQVEEVIWKQWSTTCDRV